MKKAVVCGLALAACAYMGSSLPATAYAEEQALTVDNFAENEDVFVIDGLKSGQESGDYRLAKNDKINISILDFPNGLWTAGSTSEGGDTVLIGPDGYATLPFAGRVELAGLTLDEATEVIREKLSRYVRITELYVSVKDYGKRKVYVMGEVAKPGLKDMTIDTMNAFAAIAVAGGYTNYGRSTGVQVIRVKDGVMYHRQLNMKAFVRKHDLTQNVVLQDGDIVYVPHSGAVRWKEDIMPFITGYYYIKRIID